MTLRYPILIMAALAVASCGGKFEKRFPGGDLYESKAPASTTTAGEEPGAAPRAPAQPIVLPNNRQEERGLRLVINARDGRTPAGVALPVTMTVRNTTSTPFPITYNSEKRFDVVVFADPNQQRPVYQWSANRMFSQIYSEQMLGGGSSLSRILEVPTSRDASIREGAEDDLSLPIPPGTYYLWGTHEGRPFLAYGPVEIVVEE